MAAAGARARAPLHAGRVHPRLPPGPVRVGRRPALHRRGADPAVADPPAVRPRHRRLARVGLDGRGLRPDRLWRRGLRLCGRRRPVRRHSGRELSGRAASDRALCAHDPQGGPEERSVLRREGPAGAAGGPRRASAALAVPALGAADDGRGAGRDHRTRGCAAC